MLHSASLLTPQNSGTEATTSLLTPTPTRLQAIPVVLFLVDQIESSTCMTSHESPKSFPRIDPMHRRRPQSL